MVVAITGWKSNWLVTRWFSDGAGGVLETLGAWRVVGPRLHEFLCSNCRSGLRR
jgi:hypothetical protein